MYLGNNEETKVDPYGWILAYPPAEAIVQGELNNDTKVVDLE